MSSIYSACFDVPRPPRQLTRFTDGRTIADYAWSHDGQRLAISRLSVSNDIVLFLGLR